jgi:multiple sugar transport system ATP-binding protein
MASVEIQNAFKAFGHTQVLEDISVKIEDGEFLVLVGPSGCGKSTLLRMVAGLEDITGGEILINDKVVNKLPPKERDVSMVFQNYALYPHLTVAENMGFSLMLAGAPKSEKEKRVNDVAKLLGLSDLLDRKPKKLSGGQRQRVAMGRAIVRKPQVFLFDEPLSNLDAKLRVAMRAEIKSLHQKLKSTAIYVTHDQVEAMTMADRIVVMNDGRIEQIGRPLELYDSPVNVFVAGFIGTPSMNFLEARVDLSGSEAQAILESGDELPLPELGNLSQDARIIYGMRPEYCSFSDTGTKAIVDVIEPMGAETHLILKSGKASIVVAVHDRVSLQPGEKVHILPDVSKVVIFDAESGNRI